MNEQDYKEYQELISGGLSQRKAAIVLGIDRCKIQRYLKRRLEDAVDIEDGVLNTSKVGLKTQPLMLYYDIETTLAKSYHFNYWKTNIGVKQMIEPSHMLSHAWAWNDGDVHSSVLT